ncbi:hypothetical protein NFI96_027553 [Prochilodus magdalenae]|nr:hypothetical protein NFI96_027553 [Prochilodus magdalenae]
MSSRLSRLFPFCRVSIFLTFLAKAEVYIQFTVH